MFTMCAVHTQIAEQIQTLTVNTATAGGKTSTRLGFNDYFKLNKIVYKLSQFSLTFTGLTGKVCVVAGSFSATWQTPKC